MKIKKIRITSYLAVNKDGHEIIANNKLSRGYEMWHGYENGISYLPKGSIKKLTNKKISWKDDPIELCSYQEVVIFDNNDINKK